MEFFNKAKVVRLRSHLNKFLVADEDEQTVRQSRNGASIRARWTVEMVEGKSHSIRLKSCSSGKYLTPSMEPFLTGMTGKKVVLDVQANKRDTSVEWEPIKEGEFVKLRTKGGKFLRGNGGTPPWRNSVTYDLPQRTVTQDWVLWVVDVVDIVVLESQESLESNLSPMSSFSSVQDVERVRAEGSRGLVSYNGSPLASGRQSGMEFFHKAKMVRLQSHHNKYMVADDDEETVRQSRNGSSSRARWTVEYVEGNPNVIRLKSCHGLYLSATNESFLLGMTGKKVQQYSAQMKPDHTTEWEPIKESALYVKLRTRDGKFLRANGGTPPWKNSITHDIPHRTATQDWVLWGVDVVDISLSDMDSVMSSVSSFSSVQDDYSGSPETKTPRRSLLSQNSGSSSPVVVSRSFKDKEAKLAGMSKEADWEVDEIIILKEDYDLSRLPVSPRCINLLKLSIQVSGFTEIPSTFFEHMPLLEELDLSTTNIQSLPSSISSLTSLQKLFLRDCSVLMELPSEIGMLTKLMLLDCEGSEIMYIPKEIGELSDLEVLRVSLSLYADYFLKTKRVNDSVKIPRNILLKLNKLKELCITTCPEVEWWEEEVKEIQDDLCHLEYLETLKWYLPTKMALEQFLQIKRKGKKIYENLSNFTLTIGRHPQLTSCLPANLEKKFEKFEKCLKWINAEGNEKDISMIMERAEALFLSRHWTIVRLSDFDLAKLKYCLLAECNEMETLVKVDELLENFGKVGLESIEYLTIHDMEKFQCIWNGPMGKDSLSRLRILALHACPKLTTIFTINIAQNLSSLTELTVEDCPNVTSLISNESPNIVTTGPLLPCLEKIFLLDLPDLDSTFRGKIILEKVDSLLVYNCLKLQYLSVTELPNIQKIKGEREWWNDLKCDKSRWQNVFEQLKEERKLIEQLAEATNSLQRFHDILSRDAKGKKPLDRFSLGVSDTKGHTSNFPIGEQEGLSLSQPDAKDENPLDRFSFGVTPTKGQSSNFPISIHEGLYLSQPAAKDEKLFDRSDLGVSEIKSDKGIFHLEEQEGVSFSQPGMHTPDQFSYPPSSPSPSSYSSTNSSEKSTVRRNRVKVAASSVAEAFVSCFIPPENETHHYSSSGFGGSDAFSSTSGTSDSTEGKKRGTPLGIYTTRNDSRHNREPGSTKFTMAEIHKATKNFSPALKVGQGGFGTVYKGQLQDGTLVAVKRAKKSIFDKNLDQEFQSEVQTLTKVEHLNLVKYYGYLHHKDERIIVVEYVPNGTLREHLECLNGNFLSLASRLDIAIDVAHAINYLHTYTADPVIHRDIKSSNILLTENLRAKVADFGFARLAADAELGHTHIKGTAGYLDPEYLRTYKLTEKSDVYSFGILLVELVTGRRPIEAKKELSERVTAKWAMKKFTDGLGISVLDPNLEKSDANGFALEKILELALQCVASHRQNRPIMRRCAEVLWNIRKDYTKL